MGTLSSKLRIGEKIGLGFGIVALLFLGVILRYHPMSANNRWIHA